jgi:hypothetical protein
MTPTPTLEPERFHELLADAVDGFVPASPPIDSMRRRARRRRYGWIGGAAAVVTAGAVTAAVFSLGDSTDQSTRQTVSATGPRPTSSQGISRPGVLKATLLPGLGPTSPALRQTHHRQALRQDQRRAQRGICRAYAASHTFLQADSAAVNGSTVSIVGHQGFERCGGPNDVSYLHDKPTVTYALAPGATVDRVVIGQRDRRISANALPRYLRHTQFGFFRYTGPPTAITRLIELYHP